MLGPGARLWFSCNPEGPRDTGSIRSGSRRPGERNVLTSTSPWRTTQGCPPRCWSGIGPCFRGPFTAGSCWGNGPRRQGWYMTSSPGRWCASRRRGRAAEWYISCDYGTVNPTSMGLWGRWGEAWYRVEELYYDSRREGAAEDGQRIRRRAGGTGGRAAHQGGGGRPLRRQLSGVPAAAGLAGAAGGERGALRHPHHGGAAADGPAGHLSRVRRRHPGVRAVPLGHQRRRGGTRCARNMTTPWTRSDTLPSRWRQRSAAAAGPGAWNGGYF